MQMMRKFLSLLLVLLMLPCAFAEDAAPILEVHQLVLGYADGYFIRLGDLEIMIDGGNPFPKAPTREVLDQLTALGANKLDAYIITHWHLDHCMNMNLILEAFGDENTVVYGPSVEPPANVYNEERYYPIGQPVTGVYTQMKIDDVIALGDITITCIGPEKVERDGRTNAESLNFLLQYGRRRMLFTGDYAQSNLINRSYSDLCRDVDVLKFPHHGGKPYEIGSIACRTISPEYVLVPSQLNNYQIWRFMLDNGADIPQENVLTMRAGHVVILTDGEDYLEAKAQQTLTDYAPENR